MLDIPTEVFTFDLDKEEFKEQKDIRDDFFKQLVLLK